MRESAQFSSYAPCMCALKFQALPTNIQQLFQGPASTWPQLAVILAKSLHPAPLPNFHPRRPRVFPGKSGRYAQQMHNSFHSHPGVGQNKILQDFSRHPFCRFIRSRVWCRRSSLTRHHFASKNATLQRSKSWPQAWSTNSSPNLQVQVQPQLPGMDQNISTHIRTIRILG